MQPSDRRAALLIVASAAVFVTMTTTAKALSQRYHPVEVVWARYFFHVAWIVLLMPRRVPELLRGEGVPLHLLRSTLLFLATALNFWAIAHMQLAEVSAIGFITPLLVTVLSALLLREQVATHRWLAVAAGLAGAVMIVRPGVGVFRPESLIALGFAFCYAGYQISTRLARNTDAVLSLLWGGLVGVVLASAAVPWFWRTPPLPDLALMAGIGLLGAAAHLLVIQALRIGEASMVASFSYSQLLWATLSGWIVFADLPDAWTFAGAATIAGAGLAALHLDRKRNP